MKTTIQIKTLWGSVLFGHSKENNTIKDTLVEAVKGDADLRGADLGDAYLRGADLRDAYLRGADLRDANLRGADLGDANLGGANLRGADLGGADLRGADLGGANLRGADLRDADLRDANLRGAYLRGADLRGADLGDADLGGADLGDAYLRGADLRDAYLRGAYLRDANLRDAYLRGADLKKTYPYFQIVPAEGSFIAWKKGRDNHLIKLKIPTEAKRHNHLGGRKCRAEFVKILDIRNSRGHKAKTCRGWLNSSFEYKIGEIARPDSYDPSPLNECSNGIHFFLTKEEAKEW